MPWIFNLNQELAHALCVVLLWLRFRLPEVVRRPSSQETRHGEAKAKHNIHQISAGVLVLLPQTRRHVTKKKCPCL